MNIIEGILQHRDRLQNLKSAVGDTWNLPELAFYRASWQDLIHRSGEAIAGRLDAVECIALYKEMEDFKG